ncbi:unnamed protein product, partial [Staurois parvus]
YPIWKKDDTKSQKNPNTCKLIGLLESYSIYKCGIDTGFFFILIMAR